MRKRQRLGQHFLASATVAKKIVEAAEITKKDTILEIGTGRGILLPLLCQKAYKVISIEKDSTLYKESKKRFEEIPNLRLIHGDGFKSKAKFSIFVSNLPYSQSRKAVEWLAQQKYSQAVIMIQKEFAEKLSNTGKKKRAISVLASYCAEIKHVMDVNKKNFVPNPKVDSVVIKLVYKKKISKKLIESVNLLFSFKRKKIQTILNQFGVEMQSDKRLEELSSNEIIDLAKKIIKK
jgi:16S rRNA (adenine1518-N6/adenine1519-N6)-dimethyltransferase